MSQMDFISKANNFLTNKKPRLNQIHANQVMSLTHLLLF